MLYTPISHNIMTRFNSYLKPPYACVSVQDEDMVLLAGDVIVFSLG